MKTLYSRDMKLNMQISKAHRPDGQAFSTHTHTQTDLCSRKAFLSVVTAHPRVTVKFFVLINVLSAETEGRGWLEVNKGRIGQKRERETAYVSHMRKRKKSSSLSLALSLRRVTPCSLLKGFSWDKDDNDRQHTYTHDLDFFEIPHCNLHSDLFIHPFRGARLGLKHYI